MNMSTHNVTDGTFERVQRVIVQVLQVEPERITPDARFREDLGADSLDLVELIMAIQREFDTDLLRQIDDAWAVVLERYSNRITTVGQVLEWLELLAPLCCSHPLSEDRRLQERELQFRTELLQSARPEERLLALLLKGDLQRGDFGWLS